VHGNRTSSCRGTMYYYMVWISTKLTSSSARRPTLRITQHQKSLPKQYAPSPTPSASAGPANPRSSPHQPSPARSLGTPRDRRGS
jgi:hypothetical protein